MSNAVIYNRELIEHYNRSCPRYTSYPTVAQFNNRIDGSTYRSWVQHSNEDPIPHPLSLYFHIPFCDTTCYYCACNKIVTQNRKLAAAYLDDLFREIELQSALFDSDRVVEQIYWGGGTPTYLEDDQIIGLMDKIHRHFRLRNDDGGDYTIEIDPRRTSPRTIKQLRKLGFNRLSLGVQDFNPEVQSALNRSQSFEQIHQVLDSARNARYKTTNIDLIYGLPLQTTSRFSATLERVIELNPERITLYNYAHMPQVFPAQLNIVESDLPEAEEKVSMRQYATGRLSRAGFIEIGLNCFTRPLDELSVAQRNGRLHRNFQGYSAHPECDSVAMGLSAISNIGDHYCQNTSDLDTYHDELQQNRLPIKHGFETEQTDILRRDIIQQLICYFRLDIRSIENRWKINFYTVFANELLRLAEMEKEGLLQLHEGNLVILDSGRPLVRSICSVFDRYIVPEHSPPADSKPS